jgi:hypothetical protein
MTRLDAKEMAVITNMLSITLTSSARNVRKFKRIEIRFSHRVLTAPIEPQCSALFQIRYAT